MIIKTIQIDLELHVIFFCAIQQLLSHFFCLLKLHKNKIFDILFILKISDLKPNYL